MDETKGIKDEQKQKPRYEAPKLIALNETSTGEGGPMGCTNGSGNAGACGVGTAAAMGCFAGNSAIPV